jgi:ribonuclease HII
MFVVGIDENGLGPRLGPLIATAVAIEVDTYSQEPYRLLGQSLGVDDSKAASGFGRMARVEGIALAVLERLHGSPPRDADQLLRLVGWRYGAGLALSCPPESRAQCWSVPVALPVFGGRIDQGRHVLAELSTARIQVKDVRSAVICAALINAEVERLGSKFLLDLTLFERLLLEARALLPSDMEAYCGKVGGMDRYSEYFRHLTGYTVESQGRARSSYRIAALGRVTFEVDADAGHLPVALASMVGKYVREVQMERQNRYYLQLDPSLERVSGYRDKKTSAFVAVTRPLRQRLAIADRCFERK